MIEFSIKNNGDVKLAPSEREKLFHERFKLEYLILFGTLICGAYCLWQIIDAATDGVLPGLIGIILFAFWGSVFWKIKRENDALVDAYIGETILSKIGDVKQALWKIKALEMMDKDEE